MRYKHITIESADTMDTNPTCFIVASIKPRAALALIQLNRQWKMWELTDVSEDACFDKSCLRDIINFIENHAGKASDAKD